MIRAIGVFLIVYAAACLAQDAPKLDAALNEQVIMLPIGDGGTTLETTIFKPKGDGPFPLVVINHGKASGNPRFQARARYPVAAGEFVRLGYLVAIPMRQGFSRSGGGYIDPRCNFTSNGRVQAEDIKGALDTLVKRPDVDPQRILLVGQSHGGLSVMAFGGSYDYPGVRGIINFAGGLRWSDFSCQWELSLVSAFESYGKISKVRTLWFYGDNDSYWGPTAEIPTRMYEAYSKAGGNARFIAYGRFEGGDAHSMFGMRAGLQIWLSPTQEFLRSIRMPSEPAKN
jgi:dienelactone hydrolase